MNYLLHRSFIHLLFVKKKMAFKLDAKITNFV